MTRRAVPGLEMTPEDLAARIAERLARLEDRMAKKGKGGSTKPVPRPGGDLEWYEVTGLEGEQRRVMKAGAIRVEDDGQLVLEDGSGVVVGIFKNWSSVALTSLLREGAQVVGEVVKAKAEDEGEPPATG